MVNLKDLSKEYKDQVVLKNLNYQFNSVGLYFIVGESGSGKSTLFNLIAGFDKPTEGHVLVNNIKINKLSANQLAKYHHSVCGVVLQESYFINYLSILENFKLVAGKDLKRLNRFIEITRKLNIYHTLDKKPYQVSGGELQRANLARTLAFDYPIILADEPTGSLDKATAKTVIEELIRISKQSLVIIITHDQKIIRDKGVLISLKDSKIQSKSNNTKLVNKPFHFKAKEQSFNTLMLLVINSLISRFKLSVVSVLTFSFVVFITLVMVLASTNANNFISNQTSNRLDNNYLIIQSFEDGIQKKVEPQYLSTLNNYKSLSFDYEPILNLIFNQIIKLNEDAFYEVILVNTVSSVAINNLFSNLYNLDQIILVGEAKLPFINDIRGFELINLNLRFPILEVVDENELYNHPKIYINQDYLLNNLESIKLELISTELNQANLNLREYLENYQDYLGYYSTRVEFDSHDTRVLEYERLLKRENHFKFYDIIDKDTYILIKANDEMLLKTFKDLISNGLLLASIVIISLMMSVVSIINLVLTYNFKKKRLELSLGKIFGASNLEIISSIIIEGAIIFSLSLIIAPIFYGLLYFVSYQLVKESIFKDMNLLFLNLNNVVTVISLAFVALLIGMADPISKAFKLNITWLLKND